MEIISEINATNYAFSYKKFSTSPFVLNCGSNVYVAKVMDDNLEHKHLVNEFVCYHLAVLLGIPIPQANLIRIDESMINSVPELKERKIMCTLLFGSKMIERSVQNITPPYLEIARNIEDIPSIILFDQIIYNNDRADNDGNLLFDLKSKMIVAIDHSHVFKDGLIWDEHTLQSLNDEKNYLIDNFHGKYYKMLQRFVRGNDPFSKIKNKLKTLDPNSISFIVDSIPVEWGITELESESLKNFLNHRIDNVKEIYKKIQEQCPQWKGAI